MNRMNVEIERFYTPGLAQVAYGIADPESRVAAIVDPRRDIDEYLAWAERQGVRIVAILETHVHADFVSGARELAAATGASIYAGRLGESEFPHRPLDDGEVVPVGDLRLQAFWTPGHTPEHISYLLFDSSGNTPLALFSGDTLFAGEIGRPDLLGAEQTGTLVNQLYQTVHNRLALLPDALTVYPGHGAGSPCGKQIGDSATTTISQERRVNYAFQPRTPEDFSRAVMAGMPEPPAYYPHLKRINKAGPPLLAELPAGDPLTPAQIANHQAAGALVIDARDAAEFARAHIPGAVNVGLEGSFAIWAGWLAPYNRDVVLVVPADERYAEARQQLRRVGIDNVAGYLDGGMAAWAASGRPVAQLAEVPVLELGNDASDKAGETIVLDVREDGEWAAGHLPGAVHLPAGRIARGGATGLPTGETVVVVCGSGYRSSLVAGILQARGVQQVATVPGGMDAWTAADLPTITDVPPADLVAGAGNDGTATESQP